MNTNIQIGLVGRSLSQYNLIVSISGFRILAKQLEGRISLIAESSPVIGLQLLGELLVSIYHSPSDG